MPLYPDLRDRMGRATRLGDRPPIQDSPNPLFKRTRNEKPHPNPFSDLPPMVMRIGFCTGGTFMKNVDTYDSSFTSNL